MVKGTKIPLTAEQVLKDYAAGRRDFTNTFLQNAQLSRAHLYFADFTGADFRGADLRFALFYPRVNGVMNGLPPRQFRGKDIPVVRLQGANMRGAILNGAALQYANLESTDFTDAFLRCANLSGANLEGAVLSGADLYMASFINANLRTADCAAKPYAAAHFPDGGAYAMTGSPATHFEDAVLTGADLSGSNLFGASIFRVRMGGSDLSSAIIGQTTIIDTDLAAVRGLGAVRHFSPSHLSRGTLELSQGKLPDSFLKGCGLTDWEIASSRLYDPELSADQLRELKLRVLQLRGSTRFQPYPVFISYSSTDRTFVEKLENKLDVAGVRVWRDVRTLVAGRLKKQLTEAIRGSVLLLVLSRHSINSDWVRYEVQQAVELQNEQRREVLCAISLDGAWKTLSHDDPLLTQLQHLKVLDFSSWADECCFDDQFRKLLEGLSLYYT